VAVTIAIGYAARKELDAYLDCGLLCRGFARLRCGSCRISRLVAFSCKGRGFGPFCLGRHMCATAANLVERVLPEVPLRQWVLTFPFVVGRLEKDKMVGPTVGAGVDEERAGERAGDVGDRSWRATARCSARSPASSSRPCSRSTPPERPPSRSPAP
jgi:hypothetical protein